MENLTPRQIVEQLDKFIIGQDNAKRSVAVAIRNRWRRQQLDPAIAAEVSPKNIIMVGPTGVGKTEIARRISTLTKAPFIKIEATKFTEVGYHGRDVESIIRDLLESAINMVREEFAEKVRVKAEAATEEQILDLLLPAQDPFTVDADGHVDVEDSTQRRRRARERLLEQLRAGKLDDKTVELQLQQKAVPVAMFSNMGFDQMDPDMARMIENMIPDQHQDRKVTIAQARELIHQQETEKLIDRESMTAEAIRRTEQTGIVFLDEIDKIAGGSDKQTGGAGRGPDVSRQGVQRDLLPIVEGTAVSTRHGMVHTDHILFIAAGAFHNAAISDLMPELQGRFPIRVELSALSKSDFVRILTEPDNALTRQQQALLETEGLKVRFTDEAIDAMAELAQQANQNMENIGARRLMTIMEALFEQVNFNAPDMVDQGTGELQVDLAMVNDQLASIAADEDLSRFVL